MPESVSIETSVPPGKHLVILVHGINTKAQWFGIIRRTLETRGYIAAPAGYGLYGVARFLLPFDWVMRRSVKRVYDKILLAKTFAEHDRVSVIAHSFGTYIVSRLLLEHFDFNLHRIIFCGSVAPNEFPFQKIRAQINPPIFNEIGTRDYWPVVAAALTWGYGSVGTDGFQSPVVEDRWHQGFRHSDFLTKDFCEEFFIPSLAGEKVYGDDPAPFPVWVGFLSRTHFLTRPLAAFVALAVTWFYPPPPPPAAVPEWHQLPPGTHFANRSQSPVPTFLDKPNGTRASDIDIDQVVPKPSSDDTWEEATIGQERWLRLVRPDGSFVYVRKAALQPWQQ
jgi:pimeloyl-ACP methyl ester carboxylesterase